MLSLTFYLSFPLSISLSLYICKMIQVYIYTTVFQNCYLYFTVWWSLQQGPTKKAQVRFSVVETFFQFRISISYIGWKIIFNLLLEVKGHSVASKISYTKTVAVFFKSQTQKTYVLIYIDNKMFEKNLYFSHLPLPSSLNYTSNVLHSEQSNKRSNICSGGAVIFV